MATKKTAAQGPAPEIQIITLQQGRVSVLILGQTPLIMNSMSMKVKNELLAPKGKKTTVEKKTSMKHNPMEEYRNSMYRRIGEGSTAIYIPAQAFKGSMMQAAIDLPGTRKSEIGRLCYIEDFKVDLFGIPKMRMDVVRSADINHTPDIRTRAIIEKWACVVSIRFTKPNLNEQGTTNLLAAAGQTCGVGDFRQEKGKGNFGLFTIVAEGHQDWQRIVKTGGRIAQEHAIEKPEFFDHETSELYEHWLSENRSRFGAAA